MLKGSETIEFKKSTAGFKAAVRALRYRTFIGQITDRSINAKSTCQARLPAGAKSTCQALLKGTG